MDKNEVTFEVDGIGKFTAYKVLPQKMFFMNRRTEIAKVLGGRKTLIELEATVEALQGSDDLVDKTTAIAANWEIYQAGKYVDCQLLIKKYPEEFSWNNCSTSDFNKIVTALDGARGIFPAGKREGDSQAGEPAAADTGGGTEKPGVSEEGKV